MLSSQKKYFITIIIYVALYLAPPGFRISNAKHKITDPDNISDKQQDAPIKKHRRKEQGVNCFHTILRKYKLLYFPHSRHLVLFGDAFL